MASLNDVGSKLDKTLDKISLKGIYTTSSQTDNNDRTDGGQQTLNSGTSIFFGYRRIRDETDEYNQISPFDSANGTAPTGSDLTHGGTTSGTQLYRLSDWDGYVHWSNVGDREQPTNFEATDATSGSLTFDWTTPTEVFNNPDVFFLEIYVKECSGILIGQCTPDSSPDKTVTGIDPADSSVTVGGLDPETRYGATIKLVWDETDNANYLFSDNALYKGSPGGYTGAEGGTTGDGDVYHDTDGCAPQCYALTSAGTPQVFYGVNSVADCVTACSDTTNNLGSNFWSTDADGTLENIDIGADIYSSAYDCGPTLKKCNASYSTYDFFHDTAYCVELGAGGNVDDKSACI